MADISNKKIIYLSPANHTKPYITVSAEGTGHNEKQQMEMVAKQVQSMLSEYDCTVYYPTVFNDPNKDGSFGDGDYQGRPQEAKKLGADIYVSIHSNAAGVANSTATGCVAFYHRNSVVGKRLATAFQEKLDSVCPVKSNRASTMKVIDGMTWFDGYGLGEIREPYMLGVTSVLVETNFHDYKPTAEWIVGNITVIAQAIADVLVSFYDLKKKDSSTVTDTSKIYRVQVGSFSVKSNAEACQGKLKAQGCEGIIVSAIVNGNTVYRVQIGAFTVKANADECRAALIKLGYAAIIV